MKPPPSPHFEQERPEEARHEEEWYYLNVAGLALMVILYILIFAAILWVAAN